MWELNSVKKTCLVILMPLFLGIIIVLSWIGYYFSRTELMNAENEIVRNQSQSISLTIDKDVNEKMIRLEELANTNGLAGLSEADKVKLMAAAKARYQGFSMIAYADLNGQAIGDKGEKMSRADREYIKKVKETKKAYVSDPSISGTSGKLITVLTQPVVENGQLVGFIYGTIELDYLSDLVGKINLEGDAFAYIADEKGLILGNGHHPETVGKVDLINNKVEAKDGSSGQLDAALVSGFTKAMQEKTPVSLTYKDRQSQNDEIALVTPIALADRHWAVVLAVPKSQVEAKGDGLFRAMTVLANLSLLLAIFAVYFFAKKISQPLVALRGECDRLNLGDLRKGNMQIHRKDEIGVLAEGFEKMRNTLHSVVRDVKELSETMAASSDMMKNSADQSAQASTNVAVSIGEIASGIENQAQEAAAVDTQTKTIAETASNLAETSEAIAMVAKMTVEQIGAGRDSVANAVGRMDEINQGSVEIQESVAALDRGSDEIGKIVEVISNIAGQTNLLALNAAIEAARAGEAGRGFSVVAEEVRKLAEESERSSQRIAALVSQNHQDMRKAVEASQAGKEKVENGLASVHQADQVFQSISVAVEALAEEMDNMSSAIKNVAELNKSVLTSISSIDKVSSHNSAEAQTVSAATEEQSAAMEEIASTSEALDGMAKDLKAMIGKFKV